jgi:hypothetical protein
MTIELALSYIPKRMEELGYGAGYYMRFRHVLVPPHQSIQLTFTEAIILLVEPPATVTIESSFGIFDCMATATNELQYEHQGTIDIYNHVGTIQHVQFIQVIPKNEQPCL